MEKANELEADQIEVQVSGGFKTDNVFRTAEGILGTLVMKGTRTEGSFHGSDGSELHFKKTSAWKSSYQITEASQVIGTAQPLKAISRKFSLDFKGESLLLVPGGSKLRSWRVLRGEQEPLCEIRPRGGFKRGALIQVLAASELSLLVFAYCLVSRRWMEESTAS